MGLSKMYVTVMGPLNHFLMTSIPPGPRFIVMADVINLCKGLTGAFIGIVFTFHFKVIDGIFEIFVKVLFSPYSIM